MKRCPTCNQTYAETQLFCAADGAQLVESVSPHSTSQATVAQTYHQAPPPFARAATPGKSRWLAIISVALGSIACGLLMYVVFQMVQSPYPFRRAFVSMWTLGFSGVALTLGVLLTLLSVLTGVPALALSFIKRERFGGRVPALAGPVISVIACVLALGLFTVRRVQGPPVFESAPTFYSSNSNSYPRTVLPVTKTMTDEEKYRLFYAATKTEDKFLQATAAKKIGVIDGGGKPTASYPEFTRNAMSWALNDVAFIRSVDTPSKARTYVNAHMDY